ncbi:pancreatic lipase-related protein 2-like [Ostrinia nubilalis]|uniref:pancreatic lipase-related protein 2-like n=1 Tax=Ostrinia nubilalis TaxID=29057 RepID=UPI00308254A1
MRHLVLLSVVIACVGGAIPIDNSHYVEGESRYVWLTNDEGKLVLVDLWEELESRPGTGADNEYWLFTRQNPTQRQIITHGDVASVHNSNYDASKPTKFLLHGWTSSGNSAFNIVVRDAFLAAVDCNVIVVDWNHAASGNYLRAVAGVPSVGEYIGDFLVWLVDTGLSDWSQFHLIGYSLGAHVVGNAGRRAGGRPSRVTGLDAAGPLWRLNPHALNREAGRYVEAIHTDGGIQGMLKPIADADFYPNGGISFQPGCENSGCSHSRSYQFFALSVRKDSFVGSRCNSTIQAVLQICSGEELNMGNADIGKFGTGLYGLSITEDDLHALKTTAF